MNKREQKEILTKFLIFIIVMLLLTTGFLSGIFYVKKTGAKENNNKECGQIVFNQADPKMIEEIHEAKCAIEYNEELAKLKAEMNSLSGSNSNTGAASGKYVASSRGSKYYPVDCSAANSLSENNRIYFNSEAEAESQGYEKSSACSF